ncbi:alpha-L-arabinofuranosidase, partial [Streptomyces sp. NPDC058964]
MPETTPHPSGKQPWETGWLPDTSRAPGTRRLWLAGGLAMATIVACAAAIVVNHENPDAAAAPVPSESATDDGPGLLSFASPSSGTTAEPKGRAGMPSVAPDRTQACGPPPRGRARGARPAAAAPAP